MLLGFKDLLGVIKLNILYSNTDGKFLLNTVFFLVKKGFKTKQSSLLSFDLFCYLKQKACSKNAKKNPLKDLSYIYIENPIEKVILCLFRTRTVIVYNMKYMVSHLYQTKVIHICAKKKYLELRKVDHLSF